MNDDPWVLLRDERKEQIIQAGQRVFSKRGIVGTKMSMIALEAGISHGLLYHYFKSKEELFTMIVEQAIQDSVGAVQQLYELQVDPYDKMRILTELILTENNSFPFMIIHQARTSEGVPEAAKLLVEEYSKDYYISILEPIIEEGQRKGQFAKEDARQLISTYLSVMTGLMLLNSTEHKEFKVTNADMLLRMLAGN